MAQNVLLTGSYNNDSNDSNAYVSSYSYRLDNARITTDGNGNLLFNAEDYVVPENNQKTSITPDKPPKINYTGSIIEEAGYFFAPYVQMNNLSDYSFDKIYVRSDIIKKYSKVMVEKSYQYQFQEVEPLKDEEIPDWLK